MASQFEYVWKQKATLLSYKKNLLKLKTALKQNSWKFCKAMYHELLNHGLL
jgi:hypothetical protein